jgi:hypothetical protein
MQRGTRHGLWVDEFQRSGMRTRRYITTAAITTYSASAASLSPSALYRVSGLFRSAMDTEENTDPSLCIMPAHGGVRGAVMGVRVREGRE